MSFQQQKITMPHSTYELERLYDFTGSGYFFSSETMKFHASKILEPFKRIDDKTAYFMTSEKKSFTDRTRVFSVRKATITDDNKINIVTALFSVTRHAALKFIKDQTS